MADFIVRRMNGTGEIGDWYMYIGFTEMPSENRALFNCSGLAMVRFEDRYECWFNYSFHHSLDWGEVSGMVLQPNRKYGISMEQIRKIAGDIYYNIREFISRMN
jgi:hypothetical protein